MVYNWQQPDWPLFSYNIKEIDHLLDVYQQQLDHLLLGVRHLSNTNQLDVMIQLMVLEAMNTSAIEGEFLDRLDVMSSIKRHMGLKPERECRDLKAKGIAAMLDQVRQRYQYPISASMLFAWHQSLMLHQQEKPRIKVGAWRTHVEPMQIISGPIGKPKIHFEAPPSAQVPALMKQFIDWYNRSSPRGADTIRQAPIRSAIAHLYFESIHPFEDGNGRIGRAVAEKVLAQHAGQPVPLSMSSYLEKHRKSYYKALQQAQAGGDITPWLQYFITMLIEAIKSAQSLVEFVLAKANFFEAHQQQWNVRQAKVIKRMFDAGPAGFEGGMTAQKYMWGTRCSKATATRDLVDLVDKGALVKLPGGGRNTHYQLPCL